MILLSLDTRRQVGQSDADQESNSQTVALFGVGMIGHAIFDSLQRLGYRVDAVLPYAWNDPGQRRQDARDIEAAHLQASERPASALSVVWSAGRAGFHTPAEELAPENAAFKDTLELADRLKRSSRAKSFGFHFVSSAGGLFEGQETIGPESTPSPMRPYGETKLQQEALLCQCFSALERAIYRPSSVYGPHFSDNRHGLINHLVNNGRRSEVTVLDSHVMALRDYVFSGDIGRYIARAVRFGLNPRVAAPVRFLVSSRCASIFEVVGKIERVLNLKVPFRYDEQFGNHRNITFSDRVLPPGWHPSSLEVGIRQFLMRPAG